MLFLLQTGCGHEGSPVSIGKESGAVLTLTDATFLEEVLASKQPVLVDKHGLRLLSRHVASAGKVFWIITEHDRSVTTILLPDEY